MNIMAIYPILSAYGFSGIAVIICTMIVIQVSPINVNPWSWLAKKFGKAVNGEVIEKVDKLASDLEKVKNDAEEREANQCRTRILRFNDELLHQQKHTKEHFDQILSDVAIYERYCSLHEHYKNHIADDAISRIRRIYKECGDKGTFL